MSRVLEHSMKERTNLCDNHTNSNCISTALFIAGAINSDVPYIDPQDYERYIEKFEPTLDPEPGCVSLWYRETDSGLEAEHMAVVVSVNPLRFTDRNCYEGVIRKSRRLKDIMEENMVGTRQVYLKPREYS